MITILEKKGLSDEPTRQTLYYMYETLFGKPPGKKVQERLDTAPDLLVLIAQTEDGVQAGFKIGYRQDPDTYYSWLGGVLPEFRGTGIAAALMQHQHDWAKTHGYRFIQTKTLNRWRSMLILNLKSGFDVIGTYSGVDGIVRIILQKVL
jgi:GNAT superfamily N-acetyltransferase